MGQSGNAASLVAKLYQAFNDSGFLGLGGTDEVGALAALTSARDQGLMREVDALYHKTYPDELNLKDELDDELSGDDFDTAMRLYDEGMQAAPKADAAAGSGGPRPENPVHGTLVPMAEAFSICLLDFGLKPIPNAKCRLAEFPNQIQTADGSGLVTLPFPTGRKAIDIEWTERGAEGPEGPIFALQQTVQLDFIGSDDGAVSKQLANLGFEGGTVSEQLEAFQGYLGGGKDEGFRNTRSELDGWINSQKRPSFDGSASRNNSRTV
jgi:hypothetical protein